VLGFLPRPFWCTGGPLGRGKSAMTLLSNLTLSIAHSLKAVISQWQPRHT
jgi:hypothetical protein